MSNDDGFVPPPYPYDRLDRLRQARAPSTRVASSTCRSARRAIRRRPRWSPRWRPPDTERGYPPSIGTPALRAAIRRGSTAGSALDVALDQVAACVGTKEFVATHAAVPEAAHARSRHRAVPGRRLPDLRDGGDPGGLSAGGRADRAPTAASTSTRSIPPTPLGRCMLWVNSPSNPTGALSDLDAAAAWGRRHDVPVFSDECYVEFTWDGPARTILETGTEGVVAVHSLSKRSNLAGLRVGFYAGDVELVTYLKEVRKHVGMLVPGPAQAAGAGRARRRRARRRCSAIGTAAGSSAWRRSSQRGRPAHRLARRWLLPVVRRRRRLGLRRATGSRGRRAGQPG